MTEQLDLFGQPEQLPDEDPRAAIARLQSEGYVPPPGVWIECQAVYGSEFRQCFWKSRKSRRWEGDISLLKSRKRYIGKENSPSHRQAKEAVARRNKINELKKQLR
jgi:hypothetical protein